MSCDNLAALWTDPYLCPSSQTSCMSEVTNSKGNDMNQLTIIELYDLSIQITEIKNDEHVALRHDPVQQAASDRAYLNILNIIKKRVHNETAR